MCPQILWVYVLGGATFSSSAPIKKLIVLEWCFGHTPSTQQSSAQRYWLDRWRLNIVGPRTCFVRHIFTWSVHRLEKALLCNIDPEWVKLEVRFERFSVFFGCSVCVLLTDFKWLWWKMVMTYFWDQPQSNQTTPRQPCWCRVVVEYFTPNKYDLRMFF